MLNKMIKIFECLLIVILFVCLWVMMAPGVYFGMGTVALFMFTLMMILGLIIMEDVFCDTNKDLD